MEVLSRPTKTKKSKKVLDTPSEMQGALDTTSISRAVVKIKVFGVGGGGGNVLKRLAEYGLRDVELIAVNTDAHALSTLNNTPIKQVQIGETITNGRGTGGKIEVAEQAIKRDAETIKNLIVGADLIFITAGMGGGTGTGAAPVIAEIAKTLDVLTVGVVTLPFSFEGDRKLNLANIGVTKMQKNMDALVIVKNDNLLKLPGMSKLSFVDAFKEVDFVLLQAISCISELILTTGFINVDFADVTTIFKQSVSSEAILGIGKSNVSPTEAVKNALESPLIEKSIDGARGMILNITGDETLSLYAVNEAADYIFSQNGNEVNIIFGVVIDKKMEGVVQAMVIATDFEDKDSKNAQNDYQQPMPNQNYQQTVTENAPAGNFPVFSFNPNKNG